MKIKKFKVTIECENAAFENPDTEISRILENLANLIAGNVLSWKYNTKINLFDINGNHVGTAEAINSMVKQ